MMMVGVVMAGSRHFYHVKRFFYQDRLGTNIGKAPKTKTRFLRLVRVWGEGSRRKLHANCTCSGEYILETAETSAIRVS
jgi:hypothetical protein